MRSLAWAARRVDGADRGRCRAGVRAQDRRVSPGCWVAPTTPAPRGPLSRLALDAARAVVLAVQAALGLVFDPRYRDFPFAPLTGAAVPLLAAGDVGAACGRRHRRPKGLRGQRLARVGDLHRVQRELRQLAGAVVLRRPCSRSRSLCCRRGTRQAEDQERDREAGEIGIVQHQAEAGGASATETSTIDGRTRLSAAAASATQPNTE